MNALAISSLGTGNASITPREMLDFEMLRDLVQAVPSTSLFAPQIEQDKPPIIVLTGSGRAVCRYRNDQEGIAYAKLIAAAVSSLPLLLDALVLETVDEIEDDRPPVVSTTRRALIEKNIGLILAVQPGFRPAIANTLSKLIYAAVEPFVVPEAAQPSSLSAESPTLAVDSKAIREEAISAFCTYLKEQDDPDSIPSPAALDHYFGEWKAEQS